ncbi:MAG: MBL fold metallo-hydrolase [Hyphomicrobiaceae bacterium]|nr:MBL fold metallo-hydrolase [Hyphomicrobiaceae bacterium]
MREMIKPPEKQIPGVYHRRIGDITVSAISDGFLDGNLDVLRNIDKEEARQILSESFRPARRTAVNCFLIYTAGKVALIETGCGRYMANTGGHLLANLAAAGVDPASIGSVLLTHMHPDHSAGLTDMTTGSRNFPNAELVMHENEPRHWFDDAAMAKGDDREKKLFFQAGREQTEPYRDRWRLFQKGEVLPGVTAMPFHGHTPGHTGYLISSGGQNLLIWGDIVHVPEVQTARPEVCMAFDTDKAQAEATRRRVFDMVATDRLMVTGMHLHFPGFAHLVKQGTGYRLLPAAWEQAL